MTTVDSHSRHCASCDKIVADFTTLSDDELALFLRHHTSSACGRFRADQLNKPLHALPEKFSSAQWWKAAILVPLAFFSKTSRADNSDSFSTDSIAPKAQVAPPEKAISDDIVKESSSEIKSKRSRRTSKAKPVVIASGNGYAGSHPIAIDGPFVTGGLGSPSPPPIVTILPTPYNPNPFFLREKEQPLISKGENDPLPAKPGNPDTVVTLTAILPEVKKKWWKFKRNT
jgi:hypothetical protein